MLLFIVIPRAVVPLVAVDVVNARGVVGACLAVEGVGIGLHKAVVPRCFYTVFIARKLPNSLNKQLPYSRVGNTVHIVCVGVPVVKITDNGNRLCVRRPNSENNAAAVVPGYKVRT